MKDDLTSLRMQKRKVETRVTNSNKQSIINQINKYNKQFDDYIKLSSKASVKEVERMKKQYKESLTRDIVEVAILKGNDIVAEIEGRELKKTNDSETRRLGEFGKALAKAKKQTDSKLTTEEKKFLDERNLNVKGFGNEDILKLFKKTKTKGQAEKLIEEIKSQNPKEAFYQNKLDLFERVFQKVEIVREDDLSKLKEKIKTMDFQKANDIYNYLLETLDTYGSPDNIIGKWDGEETELANARLDDVLIKTGINKKGVQKVKKVLEKYKSKE